MRRNSLVFVRNIPFRRGRPSSWRRHNHHKYLHSGGCRQGWLPPIWQPPGARGESVSKPLVFGLGQLPAHQTKTGKPFDIGAGQAPPHGLPQQQALPRLPQTSPGTRGVAPGKPFTFGAARLSGSPTPKEAAAVQSNTPLYSVTVWDLKDRETLYKIKRHAKMGEIFTDHANQRSTTPGSL